MLIDTALIIIRPLFLHGCDHRQKNVTTNPKNVTATYCRISISAKYTVDKKGITLTDVQEAEIEAEEIVEFLLTEFGIDFERTGN